MSGQRRRQLPNIGQTLGQCLVFSRLAIASSGDGRWLSGKNCVIKAKSLVLVNLDFLKAGAGDKTGELGPGSVFALVLHDLADLSHVSAKRSDLVIVKNSVQNQKCTTWRIMKNRLVIMFYYFFIRIHIQKNILYLLMLSNASKCSKIWPCMSCLIKDASNMLNHSLSVSLSWIVTDV